jgi:cbb3-type cytochrome oxidase subunit 3
MEATIILIIYLLIGICLTMYWWNKSYKKSYDEAKKSEEGVEEGMASMLLMFLFIFWPFVLIYKFLKR